MIIEDDGSRDSKKVVRWRVQENWWIQVLRSGTEATMPIDSCAGSAIGTILWTLMGRTFLGRAMSRMSKTAGRPSRSRSAHSLHHLKSKRLIPFSQGYAVTVPSLVAMTVHAHMNKMIFSAGWRDRGRFRGISNCGSLVPPLDGYPCNCTIIYDSMKPSVLAATSGKMQLCIANRKRPGTMWGREARSEVGPLPSWKTSLTMWRSG